jgi:hypothetical protein
MRVNIAKSLKKLVIHNEGQPAQVKDVRNLSQVTEVKSGEPLDAHHLYTNFISSKISV